MVRTSYLASLFRLLGETMVRRLPAPLLTGRLARLRALRPVPLVPEIRFAPPRLVNGDGERARAYYAGRWRLGGHEVDVVADGPFAQTAAPEAWMRELYRFTWLADMQAADSDLAAAQARLLVDDYLARPLFRNRYGRDVGLAAERVLQWLQASPFLLRGSEPRFAAQFGRALVRHARWMRRALRVADPVDRLRARTALLALALCLSDGERRLEKTQRNFLAELDAQWLPDGGHVSRDPSILPILLNDLLLLRQCYRHLGRGAPARIDETIEKGFVLLRFFDMGGGRLGHFNGAGLSEDGLIAALLAHDETEGRPAGFAASSGYLRFEAGGTILLADVGGPPPIAHSAHAHAGALSFELTVGGKPVIVNCGAADDSDSTVFGLSRVTAAHSTLSIGDRSSVSFARTDRFLKWMGRPLLGSLNVTLERDGPLAMAARHDGYAEHYGVYHERSLRLATDSLTLTGMDRVTSVGTVASLPDGTAAILRFHLHPSVKSWMERDGTVLLSVEGGWRWRFSVTDQRPALTDSLYIAASGKPAPTRQIEIALPDAPLPLNVEWRLTYEG